MRAGAAIFIFLSACGAGPGAASRTPEHEARADRDGNRIPDVCDECPDDPENYNACMDYDGCHDHCLPRLEYTEAEIEEAVAFEVSQVEWPTDATVVIDMAAATLLGNPDIDELACVGSGADELGRARADAVCEALTARGVDAARLVSRAVRGAEAEVRFVIVSRDGETRAEWGPDGYVERPHDPEPQPTPEPEPVPMQWDARGCPVRPSDDE